MKNALNKLYIPLRLCFANNSWISVCCLDARKDKYERQIKYKYRGQKNLAHQCYSVSKSVVALACGFLFDQGLLFPEDPVSKFLGEYFPENVDKNWYEVRLKDLFHHRTGARDCIDFDNEQAPTGEVLTALFSSPITGKTGESWNYSDGNYYILARVFEKITGRTCFDYLSEHLFSKLGFYYHTWSTDDHGHVLGGTGLYLRTEDMAKLGMIVLLKGCYNGVRYLSEEWIDICTSIENPDSQKYGFGIRNVKKGVFTITGMNGQGMFIDRTKKLVYAWHAQRHTPALSICLFLQLLHLI